MNCKDVERIVESSRYGSKQERERVARRISVISALESAKLISSDDADRFITKIIGRFVSSTVTTGYARPRVWSAAYQRTVKEMNIVRSKR